MKRILLTTVTLLIVIVVIGACFVIGFYGLFFYTSFWELSADFDGCEAEFELVKDYILEQDLNEGDFLNVSYKNYPDLDLYNYSTNQYLNCPDDIKTALCNLADEAFYNNFGNIKYEVGEMVMFSTDCNNYAIVYSPNGKPNKVLQAVPKYSESSIVCKRIKGDWYHVNFA